MAGSDGVVFHVDAGCAKLTLAAALRRWLPSKSWTEVRQLIRSRRILANGNLTLDEARRLAAGEVVKVLEHPAPKPPDEQAVKVRYLDQHVVIVEKPPGINSVRHKDELEWNEQRLALQPALSELLPKIIAARTGEKRRGGPPPVRAVHRIDRDTSGLMVFARTIPAEQGLGQQFKKHTIHRRYLAIVHGAPAAQKIESWLARDRGDGRRGSTAERAVGKRAVTHITPLERLGDYTLIECRLETGRTHQIRIHLFELGHMLCGERVYDRPKMGEPLPDKSNAPRIALHAAELGFTHPITGQYLEAKMPLPADLQKFLERLRKEAAG